MQVRFSFKNTQASAALKDYTEEKIVKLINKFVTKPVEAQITFSADRHLKNVHCVVAGGDGFNAQVEASSADIRTAVDNILDKLQTQLQRQKEKLKNHKARKGIKSAHEERN